MSALHHNAHASVMCFSFAGDTPYNSSIDHLATYEVVLHHTVHALYHLQVELVWVRCTMAH